MKKKKLNESLELKMTPVKLNKVKTETSLFHILHKYLHIYFCFHTEQDFKKH